MSNVIVKKINESFAYIETQDIALKKAIIKTLTIEDESSRFKPKFRKYGMGLDTYEFYRIHGMGDNQKLIVPTGILPLLQHLQIPNIPKTQEFFDEELDEFILKIESTLPFKLYQHQKDAFKDSLKNKQQGLEMTKTVINNISRAPQYQGAYFASGNDNPYAMKIGQNQNEDISWLIK